MIEEMKAGKEVDMKKLKNEGKERKISKREQEEMEKRNNPNRK